jgi:aminotransferase
MVEGLREIGMSCFEPKGAFYAFPSINDIVTDTDISFTAEEFAQNLLMEEKVVVIPGNVFGASGGGFIRCAYAVSQREIKEALERIGRFLERHKA